MGTLYLVATPIGNLEDISFRALRVLKEAQLIAAEDTRHTSKLLNHFGIKKPLTSYHEHNKESKINQILSSLEAGDVALVSDAGTPGLNDPGYELVKAVLDAGYQASPVPGPSAPIAALVASGLPADRFLYLGYLPRKRVDRKRALAGVADLPYTLVFLETPHRLIQALEDLEHVLGDRRIAVARELTKVYEEIVRGRISEVHSHFLTLPPRGEITLVVEGATPQEDRWEEENLRLAIEEQLLSGESPSRIAGELASRSGWDRREIYRMVLENRTSKHK